MNIADEIQEEAVSIQDEEYNIIETYNLSEAESLDNETSAIVCNATVVFVKIKNMTSILHNDGKRVASKVFRIIRKVLNHFAKKTDAYLIDYNNRSILLVYPSSIKEIDVQITNALKLSHILGKVLVKSLDDFVNLSFSIGVDHGRILGIKSNNKTFWYGTCIEKAEAISDACMKPCYLGISGLVYSELSNNLKNMTRRILGFPKKEQVWNKDHYTFEYESKHYYSTSFTIETEE